MQDGILVAVTILKQKNSQPLACKAIKNKLNTG